MVPFVFTYNRDLLRSCPLQIIFYPVRQTRTGERSLAFNAGKYWNLLPKELRLTRKIDRIKSDLKKFYLKMLKNSNPFSKLWMQKWRISRMKNVAKH